MYFVNMSLYTSNSTYAFLQATIDQDRAWVRSIVLTTLFNELRVVDFQSQAGRTAGFENITSLVLATPYAINDGSAEHPAYIRFSAPSNTGSPVFNAIYAAVFRDGWTEIFDALNRALSTPVVGDPDPAATTALYSTALTVASTWIRNSIGFYNLRTFETEYQLSWGV